MAKNAARIYRRFVFTHEFFRFLLIDRVEIEKDNIVLVTGKRGSGKSTYGIKMALGFNNFEELERFYNKEMNIKLEENEKQLFKLGKYTNFDMERDIVFTNNELQDLCQNSRKGFIVSDEAIVSTGRRNSMTKVNKILHQILTINRKNFNTIFFCLPSVEDFDVSILQYVSCWVHIDDRGLGAVLLPNMPSIFGRKSWDIDKMKKIYDKFLEDNPTALQVPYWLFDNFKGYVKFGKLPKKIEERYTELAHEKKNKEIQKNAEEKVKKPRIDDTKKDILKKIADKLASGEMTDQADFYKYCGDLEFKKEKLRKEVSEILAASGEGRTVLRIIKANSDRSEMERYESDSIEL